MSIETMGSTIAALRKEKNVTQEELADYVGVSAQAVSKWEKGGAPDCALLPRIADFFGVSIDRLFGRKATDYMEVEEALAKKIMDTPEAERKKLLFSLCWTMEKALFDIDLDHLNTFTLEDIAKEGIQNDSVHHDQFGYTLMGLGVEQTYFLLVPDAEHQSEKLLKDTDYPALFAALSNQAIFNTLIYLSKTNGKFTVKTLTGKLGLSSEKANEVLAFLQKYKMLCSEDVEIDGTVYTLYSLISRADAAFASMLIFAKQMIERANSFYCSKDGIPYLA